MKSSWVLVVLLPAVFFSGCVAENDTAVGNIYGKFKWDPSVTAMDLTEVGVTASPLPNPSQDYLLTQGFQNITWTAGGTNYSGILYLEGNSVSGPSANDQYLFLPGDTWLLFYFRGDFFKVYDILQTYTGL